LLDGGGVDHGEEFGLRGGGGEGEWWRASRWPLTNSLKKGTYRFYGHSKQSKLLGHWPDIAVHKMSGGRVQSDAGSRESRPCDSGSRTRSSPCGLTDTCWHGVRLYLEPPFAPRVRNMLVGTRCRSAVEHCTRDLRPHPRRSNHANGAVVWEGASMGCREGAVAHPSVRGSYAVAPPNAH
jgi:hypothetical protein